MSRETRVVITGPEGHPAPGAVIDVYVNGTRAASINSSGSSSVEVSNPAARVELEIAMGSHVRRATISPGQPRLDISFPTIVPLRADFRAGAKCPDGTTGQPCVICKIGPDHVRVCG